MEWSKLLPVWIVVLLFFLVNCSTSDPVQAVVVPSEIELQGTLPSDGEMFDTTCVTFEWNHTEHEPSDHYYILLLDTVNPPQAVYRDTTSQHCFESIDISRGTTYFWQIVSSDSCSSGVYSFSVQARGHTELIDELRGALYLLGVLYENELYGIGTGFAINEREIMTNAHVVNALRDIIRDYGREDFQLVALKDGFSIESSNCFRLDSSSVHPLYDYVDIFTYDFGIVTITEGVLESHLEFASTEQLNALAVGDEIFTIGFPGETNDLNHAVAISTYKSGTISALRPLQGNGEQFGRSVIQHDCNTTAGTSGSPLFNMDGKVIAIHNSGEYEFVYTYDEYGSYLVRIPVGALNYSIKADLRDNLDESEMVSFEDIVEDSVWYTFVNNTWSDIEIDFVDLFSQFIGYKDTLHFWDYRGFAGISDIEVTTLFENHNYTWRDTLPIGTDYERIFSVDSSLFLLGVSNQTNQSVNEIYVKTGREYDTAGTDITCGGYKDIGYFTSSESTSIEFRFFDSKVPVTYDNLNTISENGEAMFLFLEPDAELPDTRSFSAVKTDPAEKRVYRLSDYVRSLQSM